MSKYIEGRHLSKLQSNENSQIVFWTYGNFPTQQVEGLTERIVLDNFKLLYLLSGTIVVSASCYFESSITQSIAKILKDFFEDGSAAFFFDENLEGPVDHARSKILKSPSGALVYKDSKSVLSAAKKLELLGDNLIRRKCVSISNIMVDLWIDDVLSNEAYSIGYYVDLEIKIKGQQKIIKKKLIDFVKRREKEFVWEFIQPVLLECGLSSEKFNNKIRQKLSQMYSLATATALEVSLDKKVSYSQINKYTKHDSFLFAQCLKQLGLLDKILSMSTDELRALKNSLEFGIFREFYFKFIDGLTYSPELISSGIAVVYKFEDSYIQKKDDRYFVENFLELVSNFNLPKEKFRANLDEVRNIIDKFNIFTIDGFVNRVKSHRSFNENKERDELINYKVKEYKHRAIITISFYVIFLLLSIYFFFIDTKLKVLANGVLNLWIGSALFIIPFIRSFFDHKLILEHVLFLISKDKQKKVRMDIQGKLS